MEVSRTVYETLRRTTCHTVFSSRRVYYTHRVVRLTSPGSDAQSVSLEVLGKQASKRLPRTRLSISGRNAHLSVDG